MIEIEGLLDNFKDFIARVGFRILQVPETPQEYVGQHLLYTYLDHFVHVVGANMLLEVQTGRGRIDLLILPNQHKYIVETKIWEGDKRYQAGKRQLVRISHQSACRKAIMSSLITGTVLHRASRQKQLTV